MRLLLSLMLIVLLASPVLAARGGQQGEEQATGGFEGPVRGAQAETVEKALKLAPDSRVILKGNIVASVAGEKNVYIFKDNTGEITVAITPKQFKGNTIKPDTSIQITGKIVADNPEGIKLRVSKLDPVQ